MDISPLATANNKIQSLKAAMATAAQWQNEGLELVFTNGCFDILHFGHLHYLAQARALGDKLIIGLNSGASVAKLKGAHRPIQDEATRRLQLAVLAFVDLVIEFDEDTPQIMIEALRPDILVKGGDYELNGIVGADFVQSIGGWVTTLPFMEGYSTTAIENKIRALSKEI